MSVFDLQSTKITNGSWCVEIIKGEEGDMERNKVDKKEYVPFVIATTGARRQLKVEVELFDICKFLNILLCEWTMQGLWDKCISHYF